MDTVTKNIRYQSRYWILIYPIHFNTLEYERFLATKGIEYLTVFETTSKINPSTIVFIVYYKSKELQHGYNDTMLILPKEFRHPVIPMVLKRKGKNEFDSFLQAVKENKTEYGECNIVIGGFDEEPKFFGKKDDKFFAQFKLENSVPFPTKSPSDFVNPFYIFVKETFYNLETIITIYKKTLSQTEFDFFAKDLFDILLRFKPILKFNTDNLNFILDELLKRQDVLINERDQIKQNKRFVEKNQSFIEKEKSTSVPNLQTEKNVSVPNLDKDSVLSDKTKSKPDNRIPILASQYNKYKDDLNKYYIVDDREKDLVLSKKSKESSKTAFDFSNQQDKLKLKKQIMSDYYQEIDYISIFKIEKNAFSRFLEDIITETGEPIRSSKNRVLRFLAMEFNKEGDDKPLKPRLRSGDSPLWFAELYPYLPIEKQKAYEKNIKKNN